MSYLWRPHRIRSDTNLGEVFSSAELGTSTACLPRAPWHWIEECLAGDTPAGWEQVRCVRLDGPKATDSTLHTLAERGALDGITRLELRGSSLPDYVPLSDRALQIALRLPLLESLLCESLRGPGLALESSATLRRIELYRCSATICTTLLEAADSVREVEIDHFKTEEDASAVLARIAGLTLSSLTLRYMTTSNEAVQHGLTKSLETLRRLCLVSIAGVQSNSMFSNAPCSGLEELVWWQPTLQPFEGALPDSLESLSLRGDQLGAFGLDEGRWPTSLCHLDLVGCAISPALSKRLCAELPRLRSLGLGSGENETDVLNALMESPPPSLRALHLGPGGSKGVWRAPISDSLTEILPGLTDLSVVGQLTPGSEPGWHIDHELLGGLLRGQVAPALRDLRVHEIGMDIDLDGGFAPKLRILEFHTCGGVIEGLTRPEQPLPLARLVLDGMRLAEDQLCGWLAGCSSLASLTLTHVPELGPKLLTELLQVVSTQLVQLVVEGLNAHGDQRYQREISAAFTSAHYPQLAELSLFDISLETKVADHLIRQASAPRLERFAFDTKASDEDIWLVLAEHASPRLHWISGNYPGVRDDLAWLLDDPDSRISAACVSLF